MSFFNFLFFLFIDKSVVFIIVHLFVCILDKYLYNAQQSMCWCFYISTRLKKYICMYVYRINIIQKHIFEILKKSHFHIYICLIYSYFAFLDLIFDFYFLIIITVIFFRVQMWCCHYCSFIFFIIILLYFIYIYIIHLYIYLLYFIYYSFYKKSFWI